MSSRTSACPSSTEFLTVDRAVEKKRRLSHQVSAGYQDLPLDLALLVGNRRLQALLPGLIRDLEQGDGEPEDLRPRGLAHALFQLVERSVEPLVDADGKGLHPGPGGPATLAVATLATRKSPLQSSQDKPPRLTSSASDGPPEITAPRRRPAGVERPSQTVSTANRGQPTRK